ncbi:pentatricopeptide repeat-containing protein At5g48910-like [Macadamia integrifolia]|uniref:pentatricopeptide repeat-containing protein At5g48910-like n=1 Tax=Macadamia integrifolia TaxID=60698 RepID=UPI001C5279DE|nr:pentatricopeptide repeat-containing protein At5g48910-like [Macadamia integrifolia]
MKDFKPIHAHILRSGQIMDSFVASKMLEFCAVSGRNIDYALHMFNYIDSRDAYMWTTMIRGFVQVRMPEKAIEFYYLMRSQGFEPNKFTFLFVLKAYSLIPNSQEAIILYGKLLKLGFYFDEFIRNALIHVYLKCGDIMAARLLFDEIPTDNVVIWNTMISGCFNYGDTESAQKLFDEMPNRNVASWNAVISGYSKCGHIDVARSVFDVMPEKDLVSWSVMISSYVQSRRAGEALNLFKEMQLSGIQPDGVTMASVLSACAQVGALDMGRWIHAYVAKNKLRHDVFLGTSLVDMYAKSGCIDTALQVFNSMPQRNVCSWNAMLGGLAMHGRGADTLALFREMESSGLAPNDVTFVGVLSACNHIGSVDEGRRQFDRMENEFNIKPKIEHYGCMVDILGRSGLIDEAKTLIKNMPVEPNVVVWGALLTAFKIQGDTDVGEEVMRGLKKMAPGDGGCYVLLSNIYAAGNQWGEVEKMRKMMRNMGTKGKVPGCSSIEVSSVVHEFFVNDKSHPQCREVYELISRISKPLEVEGYVPNPSLVLYNIDE